MKNRKRTMIAILMSLSMATSVTSYALMSSASEESDSAKEGRTVTASAQENRAVEAKGDKTVKVSFDTDDDEYIEEMQQVDEVIKMEEEQISAEKTGANEREKASRMELLDTSLSASEPIQINDAESLMKIAVAPDADYILTADIDLSGVDWTPIPEFTGTLDGNGKSISHLTVHSKSGGLILSLSGTVKNLTIKGASVGPIDENGEFICNDESGHNDGYIWNAGLAGIMQYGSSVSGCTVTDSIIEGQCVSGGMFGIIRGTVTDCKVVNTEVVGSPKKSNPSESMADLPYYLGGFAGSIQCGVVEGCMTENCTVEGAEDVGGFAGHMFEYRTDDEVIRSADVKSCSVSGGNVSGSYYRIGGFFGSLLAGTVTDCTTDSPVNGQTFTGGFAGKLGNGAYTSALAGDVAGPVSEGCSAAGSVIGSASVGGFAGYADNSTTYNCSATGDVKATGSYSNWGMGSAGGFVGIMGTGTPGFQNCYASGDVKANKGVGGFVGLSMIRYLIKSDVGPSRDNPYDVKNNGGIVQCYASGDVTATDQFGYSAAGGFAGQLQDNSVPVDCYASGTVDAYNCPGGFAGSVIGAAAINCYASGKVNYDGSKNAGSFAGMISRPDIRTVCLVNCIASNELSGTKNTIGYRNSNLKKTYEPASGIPAEKNWPSVNPEVTVTNVSAEQMQSKETFASLSGLYGYASYAENKYVEETKGWDFDNVWAIDEGMTTPYLKNTADVQAVVLEADRTCVELGGTVTVELKGYAGYCSSVNWTVEGAGELISTGDCSVTVKASENGLIDISAIINGTKAKSLKIVSGTGGKDGMTVSFLSPAPVEGNGSESYCVEPDASLMMRFSEPADKASLKERISLKGGFTNTEIGFNYELSEDGRMVTVIPAEKLEEGQSYVLSLSESISAESGKMLVGVNSIRFLVRSFEAPSVTYTVSEGNLTLTAEYTNNIKHYDEDAMEEVEGTDSAEVYISIRYGRGARQEYGGTVLGSEKRILEAPSGQKTSVSADFDISSCDGDIYADVYTWDAESGSYAAASTVNVKIDR